MNGLRFVVVGVVVLFGVASFRVAIVAFGAASFRVAIVAFGDASFRVAIVDMGVVPPVVAQARPTAIIVWRVVGPSMGCVFHVTTATFRTDPPMLFAGRVVVVCRVVTPSLLFARRVAVVVRSCVRPHTLIRFRVVVGFQLPPRRCFLCAVLSSSLAVPPSICCARVL